MDFQGTPVVITYGSLNLPSVVNFRNNCESVEFDYHAARAHLARVATRRDAVVRGGGGGGKGGAREMQSNASVRGVAAQLQSLASRYERSVCRGEAGQESGWEGGNEEKEQNLARARDRCSFSFPLSRVKLLYCNGETFRRPSFVAFPLSRGMSARRSATREKLIATGREVGIWNK